MKVEYVSTCLLFASIFLLTSCEVNDSDEKDYSQSVSKNGVTVFIKNGTLNTPGEIKIVNNSSQQMFVPFILYPYCSFSFYSLAQKNDSVWAGLLYQENKWIKNTNQDSIVAVCAEYRNPIAINPFQSLKQKISSVDQQGEFRVAIYFRYSEIVNPDSPNKEIIINYLVK